ncbi:hypothetical protein QE250_01245 [Chromatiaceae bacterium AAb-1]|nr:hypothetical protein [Chromatiaceae bacterium AAb-1]
MMLFTDWLLAIYLLPVAGVVSALLLWLGLLPLSRLLHKARI